MKKILVVLLTLAVAGGVFAQGWSLGASAWIGTYINFDPMYYEGDEWQPILSEKDDGEVKQALVVGIGYHRYDEYWSGIRGNFNMGYSAGSLNVGIEFQTSYTDGSQMFGTDTANGENYTFVVAGNLGRIISQDDIGGADRMVHRLWGQYDMVGGMVQLEVAYYSKDNGDSYWTSNKAALGSNVAGGGASFAGSMFRGLFGTGDSFAKVDGHNYIRPNLVFGGIEFGLLIPDIFRTDRGDVYADAFGAERASATSDLNIAETRFVEDALGKSIFGVKFAMSPVDFAAQFRLRDYGVYFGGNFNAGPLTAGLSFHGILRNPDPDEDDRTMSFGASLDYDGGAFGAGVRGWYKNYTPGVGDSGTNSTVIGIEPTFFYNIIPTHLRFKLNAGFYFDNVNEGGEREEQDVYWAVQPQLFWNFNGTGAGEFWSMGTGMIVRYRLVSSRVNQLDVTFKFSL